MERLTYNDGGCWQVHGADEMLCKQVCEEYSNCDSCPIGRAIDRLAEYEDTGLTVERANRMTLREAMSRLSTNRSDAEILQNLRDAGLIPERGYGNE